MSTTIAPAPVKTQLAFGPQGVQLASLEDAYRFATAVVKSGLAPKGFDTPEAVLIAIQHGAELGLPPMASLQSIAVINGRPGIYGDSALALVRSSNLCQSFTEWYEVDGKKLVTAGGDLRTPTVEELKKDSCTAFCRYQRKGDEAQVSTFSIGDARLAQLLGKVGPWSQYPSRMLRFRSRGFGLRDGFGDVLKGLRFAEELQDIPPERNVTPPRGLVESLEVTMEGQYFPAAEARESQKVDVVQSEDQPAGPPSQKEKAPPVQLPPRANVIAGMEAHMLALSVPESKVWKWATEVWPHECDACQELKNLPTEILLKIKEAIPSMVKP